MLENLAFASPRTISPRTAESGQLSVVLNHRGKERPPGSPLGMPGVGHPAEVGVDEISEARVVRLGLHR